MLCHTTELVRIPLSQCTAAEIDARALEFQRRAATAGESVDRQALIALAGRYAALAKRRKVDEACRTDECAGTPGAAQPMGLPSPQAAQMASDAIGRQFVLPETMQHPVITAAAMELAYLFMAYGMVPPDQAVRGDLTEKPGVAGSLGTSPHTGHHILVVDDAPDVLVIVGAFLAGACFAVRKTDDGEEALRLIASDPSIDLLITDFAMPGLNGGELIARAAKIRPHLKALVITGYPNAGELAELPPQATVLAKPFRRDALLAWVTSGAGKIGSIPDAMMAPLEHAG